MGVEADILVNNYGISLEFAENLLTFFEGDVDKVIRLMESSDKDIAVIKGKFLASRRNLYGAYVLFYNYQSMVPEYVFVVTSSDMNLSRVRVEDPWMAYVESLRSYQSAAESDPEIASRIEAQMLSRDNIPVLSGYLSDRTNPDLINLKRFFTNEVNRIIYDSNVLVKFVIEEADIFRIRAFLSSSHDGLKAIANNPTNLVLMNLKIEPILSPLGGKDVESLSLSDEVYVRVQDDREIVPELIERLRPPDVVAQNTIVGKVVENILMPESENRRVTLLFGPGIFGSFILGGKVRVQIRPQHQQVGSSSASREKTSSSNEPFVVSLNFDADGNPVSSSDTSSSSLFSESEPPLNDRAQGGNKVSSAIIVGIVAMAVLALLILVFSFFLY
jgi:hypothetical protein